ncbi:hypothetical protein EJ110_NYTH30562 [Nymphaea thermarum]|nr:hypothetical protein EJ110_NYTH30562 [Nymphaea thermarum]
MAMMSSSSTKHRCFNRRCSRLVKEQKARLYILRRDARSWLFSTFLPDPLEFLQEGFHGPVFGSRGAACTRFGSGFDPDPDPNKSGRTTVPVQPYRYGYATKSGLPL